MQPFDYSLIRTQQHYPVDFGLGDTKTSQGDSLRQVEQGNTMQRFPTHDFRICYGAAEPSLS